MNTTVTKTKKTENGVELEVLSTMRTPAKTEVDSHMMEKVIEVNRITSTQELKRQMKEKKDVYNALVEQLTVAERTFVGYMMKKELAKLRTSAPIKALAKALTAVLPGKVSAVGLISDVSFKGENGTYRDGFFDKFRNHDTEIGMEVETSFSVQKLATASDIEDAEEDDDIDEDHLGRQTISAKGWFEWLKLNRDDQKAVQNIRDLEARRKLANQEYNDLETRLKNVGEQSEALKAQIYRKQISEVAGGDDMIKLLDASLAATIKGDYLALL